MSNIWPKPSCSKISYRTSLRSEIKRSLDVARLGRVLQPELCDGACFARRRSAGSEEGEMTLGAAARLEVLNAADAAGGSERRIREDEALARPQVEADNPPTCHRRRRDTDPHPPGAVGAKLNRGRGVVAVSRGLLLEDLAALGGRRDRREGLDRELLQETK